MLGEKLVSVSLVQHKPTWTGLGLNLSSFSERPAANDLNHIMAEHQSYRDGLTFHTFWLVSDLRPLT